MVSVRPAREDEWAEAKRLRLEMLADTPHAFDTPVAEALTWSDERWRTRHRSNLMFDSTTVAAVDDQGRWRGTMSARLYQHLPQPTVWLLGVYLTPSLRGSGIAEAMLAQVEAWARAQGVAELYLDVQERAVRARRFYARIGFTPTGATQPHPRQPDEVEIELRKPLGLG